MRVLVRRWCVGGVLGVGGGAYWVCGEEDDVLCEDAAPYDDREGPDAELRDYGGACSDGKKMLSVIVSPHHPRDPTT